MGYQRFGDGRRRKVIFAATSRRSRKRAALETACGDFAVHGLLVDRSVLEIPRTPQTREARTLQLLTGRGDASAPPAVRLRHFGPLIIIGVPGVATPIGSRRKNFRAMPQGVGERASSRQGAFARRPAGLVFALLEWRRHRFRGQRPLLSALRLRPRGAQPRFGPNLA